MSTYTQYYLWVFYCEVGIDAQSYDELLLWWAVLTWLWQTRMVDSRGGGENQTRGGHFCVVLLWLRCHYSSWKRRVVQKRWTAVKENGAKTASGLRSGQLIFQSFLVEKLKRLSEATLPCQLSFVSYKCKVFFLFNAGNCITTWLALVKAETA